eukprot:3791557-Rhodomonas_salina.2
MVQNRAGNGAERDAWYRTGRVSHRTSGAGSCRRSPRRPRASPCCTAAAARSAARSAPPFLSAPTAIVDRVSTIVVSVPAIVGSVPAIDGSIASAMNRGISTINSSNVSMIGRRVTMSTAATLP